LIRKEKLEKRKQQELKEEIEKQKEKD